MNMAQAFDDNSQTHLPYPADFLPDVDQLERRIILVWSELCAASRNQSSFAQEAQIAELHDLGVLRFRAQRGRGLSI